MRHLRWLIPLLLVPLTYFGCSAGVSWLSAREPVNSEPEVWVVIATLVLVLSAFVLPIVAFVVFVVQAVRTYRGWRRSRGRYTKAEQLVIDRHREDATAWNFAVGLRRSLVNQQVPTSIERPWDIVPYPDEVFFLDVPAQYARYYGQDVTYTQSSPLAIGSPAFVVGVLAASAISNGGARRAAQRQAAEQWREHQNVRVIVSNRRLICVVRGQPLTFDYAAMVGVYPEVQHRTLVCQFGSTEPLMLSGPHVPGMAVLTTMMTLGEDALGRHPKMQVLEQEIDVSRHPVTGRSAIAKVN